MSFGTHFYSPQVSFIVGSIRSSRPDNSNSTISTPGIWHGAIKRQPEKILLRQYIIIVTPLVKIYAQGSTLIVRIVTSVDDGRRPRVSTYCIRVQSTVNRPEVNNTGSIWAIALHSNALMVLGSAIHGRNSRLPVEKRFEAVARLSSCRLVHDSQSKDS